MTSRAIVLCGLLAGGVLVVRGVSFSQTAGEKLPPPKQGDISEFKKALSKQIGFVGAGSCSASACHSGRAEPAFVPGGDVFPPLTQRERGVPGNEYTTWTKDPHSRAYEVLHNEVSHRISKSRSGVPAYEDALCLRCHVHPLFEKGKHSEWFASDGVSCESCHGPAQNWLHEHYRPGWKEKTAKEKLAEGMCDTRSLIARVRLCVDCHVGSPEAEVNHDLIAAGHPRLNFEFAAFHARMPHHWPDAKDKDPDWGGTPDFEARAWVVGQVISAKAALQLLAHRASDKPPSTQYSVLSTEKRIWPEFAEYDCYSCHHDLAGSSWRQEQPGRKPGKLSWNSWYLAMTPTALTLSSKTNKELADLVRELHEELQKPGPNRDKAARKANEASLMLLNWHDSKENIPAADWLKRILKAQPPEALTNWDEAAQLYLALAAMHHAAADSNDPTLPPRLHNKLEALGRSLLFPQRYNSPGNFHSNSFRDQLRKLQ